MLLEEWSVWKGEGHPDNKVGWALDPKKTCDYIAYAFWDSKKCYVVPYKLLRQTFENNRERWKGKYMKNGKVVEAPNKTYRTLSVPVPWDELRRCLAQERNEMFVLD